MVQYVPLLSQTPIYLLPSSVKYTLPVIQSMAIPDSEYKPYLREKYVKFRTYDKKIPGKIIIL